MGSRSPSDRDIPVCETQVPVAPVRGSAARRVYWTWIRATSSRPAYAPALTSTVNQRRGRRPVTKGPHNSTRSKTRSMRSRRAVCISGGASSGSPRSASASASSAAACARSTHDCPFDERVVVAAERADEVRRRFALRVGPVGFRLPRSLRFGCDPTRSVHPPSLRRGLGRTAHPDAPRSQTRASRRARLAGARRAGRPAVRVRSRPRPR